MSVVKSEGTKARPFLKWVGGKGRVISELEKYFPKKFNSYFEPFLGGGAVFFNINSKAATINDLNQSLIGAYLNIRDNVESLIEELSKLQNLYVSLDEEKQKDMFYTMRDEFNSIIFKGSIRKSVLLIFLNKTCFNGMYRENKSGKFNVPFGRHSNPTICDEKNLVNISDYLENTTVLSTNYGDALKSAKAGDFVYLDPPYYPLNPTSSFTSYNEDDFIEKDQRELKDLVDDLTKRGCKVMLSNSDTEFIKELYKDYRHEFIYAHRSINSKGDGRSKISEVVVMNY